MPRKPIKIKPQMKTILTLLAIVTIAGNAPAAPSLEIAPKWKTTGLQQANTMGAGEAAIREGGKFRVFILMGQSNMNGSGRAVDLEAPYNQTHERIRIWANGRWEYMVPRNKFGPGVSMAHQLADFWPDDTIGIVKVSCGATGISAFEKNWSFERAERSKDGKKGLAEEYSKNLKQLISDLSEDLGVSNIPTFIPSYARDQELLKGVLSRIDKEGRLAAKKSAGKDAAGAGDALDAVLAYVDANGLFKNATPIVKKQRYLATVISAQNRLGRELSHVTTFYPGKLPIGDDGVHYSSEGYIMLGKATASAIEESYKQ